MMQIIGLTPQIIYPLFLLSEFSLMVFKLSAQNLLLSAGIPAEPSSPVITG